MQGWIAIDNDMPVGTHHSFGERVRYQCRIAAGDLLFFRNRLRLTTITRVHSAQCRPVNKRTQRCPMCAVSDIKIRRTRLAPYRCIRGHEFAEPAFSVGEGVTCELSFSAEKIDVLADITVAELRPFELTNSPQLPLRPCDCDGLLRYIATRDHRAAKTLRAWLSQDLLPLSDVEADVPHTVFDGRIHRLYGVRLRRGPADVRNALLRAAGRCAISGCAVTALLEVACIHGVSKARNVANCILLRGDLHTLFDLNLIGIDPERLVTVVRPELAATSYREFDGAALTIAVGEGRRRALAMRWREFCTAEGRTGMPEAAE